MAGVGGDWARPLAELGLNRPGSATVLAVVRGGHAMTDLASGFCLAVGDTLVLAGTHAAMERAFEDLSPPVQTV